MSTPDTVWFWQHGRWYGADADDELLGPGAERVAAKLEAMGRHPRIGERRLGPPGKGPNGERLEPPPARRSRSMGFRGP